MEIVPITDIEQALETLWEHDAKSQAINFPKDQPNRELFEKKIRENYPEHADGFFFVHEGDAIIGSLILRTPFNPYRKQRYGEVWYIYLAPECRGKGYGKKLLEFADAYFKRKGCAYAFAGISAVNPASNALFEKAGYVTTRHILEKPY